MLKKLFLMSTGTVGLIGASGYLLATKNGLSAESLAVFMLGLMAFVWSGALLLSRHDRQNKRNRILRDLDLDTGYQVFSKTFLTHGTQFVLSLRDLNTGEEYIAGIGSTFYPPNGFKEEKLPDWRIFLIPTAKSLVLAVMERGEPVFTPTV